MMFQADAYNEAFEAYRKALSHPVPDVDASIDLVPAAVAAHRESEAYDLLKSLGARSSNQGVRTAMSKLMAAQGNFEEAVRYAVEACRLAQTDLAPWEQLASIYSDAGDGERLADVLTTMQRLAPQSAVTSYYAAASFFLRSQFEAALRAVQESIAADGRRARTHNLLGAINASLGNADAARRAFLAALDLDPRDITAYTNLALLDLQLHDPSSARRLFAEALSLDPESETARQGLIDAEEAMAH
jgi:Flp pilus assembly protein TadD